ncbi:MAG: methyl-accepting chemotaxis protein [bacterium]
MRSSSFSGKSGAGLSKAVWVWSVLFLIFMGLMGYALYQSNRQTTDGEKVSKALSSMKLIAQRMTTYGLESARGQAQAFLRLRQLEDEFSDGVLKLNGGAEGFPELPKEFEPDVLLINELWRSYREDVDTILSGRGKVSGAINSIKEVEGVLPDLKSASQKVVEAMRNSGTSGKQVYYATYLQVLVERIENSLIRILSGDIAALSAADEFGDDVATFSSILDGMLKGGGDSGAKRVSGVAARKALAEVADAFSLTADNAGVIVSASPLLYQVAESANRLEGRGSKLFDALSRLEGALADYFQQADLGAKVSMVFALLALLSFLMLVYVVYRGTRHQLQATQQTNSGNQQAILQLLDEMSTLAEGDLTVEASVTEDITGAIADSMNYAIDSMRQLVKTITASSSQVEETARLTQNTATELAATNREQAKQITTVSRAVEDLTRSIAKVSQHAEDSADVAELSVEIAHKGANTVRGTIEGMDSIREKIQDTAKRIKRLGESSQEIGDIVGLITDIADQTNILALNAAIQASAAGEGGRGFAVVADEVQRLAERSANASKQIEALVKTIQADTHEAVHSMEQSTANVVAGANLAEEAGKALSEIETVSHSMAGLITDISAESREQAAISNVVAENMESIQRITTQTVATSNDTATAIGELVEQSTILKQSVEGFKLPEEGGSPLLDEDEAFTVDSSAAMDDAEEATA